MTYYVLCEGGKPKSVHTDLIAGLASLTESYLISEKEQRTIKKASEMGIEIGERVMVVGYQKGQGWTQDRSLTRVS